MYAQGFVASAAGVVDKAAMASEAEARQLECGVIIVMTVDHRLHIHLVHSVDVTDRNWKTRFSQPICRWTVVNLITDNWPALVRCISYPQRSLQREDTAASSAQPELAEDDAPAASLDCAKLREVIWTSAPSYAKLTLNEFQSFSIA